MRFFKKSVISFIIKSGAEAGTLPRTQRPQFSNVSKQEKPMMEDNLKVIVNR